jgi:hypothetical protein
MPRVTGRGAELGLGEAALLATITDARACEQRFSSCLSMLGRGVASLPRGHRHNAMLLATHRRYLLISLTRFFLFFEDEKPVCCGQSVSGYHHEKKSPAARVTYPAFISGFALSCASGWG